jgi:hydroxymethylpyrimidine pyrophosphatase-like HAD family hydrolase
MMVYCDIDGTLTDSPYSKWGNPKPKMIEAIKKMIAKGTRVVIWSGGGEAYAKAFAKKYEIDAAACLGKPRYLIDDNPTIRPRGRMPVLSPDQFLQAESLR